MSNINENNINDVSEEQISVDDIITACCGTDGTDNTKAGFALDFGIYNPSTNEFDIKTSTAHCDPILNITRLGETTMIDYIFESKVNAELRRIWALLQKHGKDCELAFRNGAKNIPFMRVHIVPIGYSGQYSILAYAPIYWTLQPEYPSGEITMLRMVFKTEQIMVAENEAYDETELAAQIQREEMQREYIEQEYERKLQEEEDYRDERQQNLEELRRNRQDYS
jgi:hypothetical protein